LYRFWIAYPFLNSINNEIKNYWNTHLSKKLIC
jgi:hypothetical protein